MDIQSVVLVYFSATGTTKKILKTISKSLGDVQVETLDLTKKENREKDIGLIAADLLILGMPVYEEHIPPFVEDCLKTMQGQGQPALVVGVFGNVGYGMSLVDMQEILNERGFKTMAGAAFAAEHSFSHDELPVAVGRPDANDLVLAAQFGEESARVLVDFPNGYDPEKKLHGYLPLMARILPQDSSRFFADLPQFNPEQCSDCGACIKKCPVDAIDPESYETIPERCIRCFACVRVCTTGSRSIRLKMKPIVKRFFKSVQENRKEPVWFFL